MAHVGGTRKSDDRGLLQEVTCRLSSVLTSKPTEVQVNICELNVASRAGFHRGYLYC